MNPNKIVVVNLQYWSGVEEETWNFYIDESLFDRINEKIRQRIQEDYSHIVIPARVNSLGCFSIHKEWEVHLTQETLN
jgi:hypothetical protein